MYAIMVTNKGDLKPVFYAPLSYGRGEETSHKQLLMRNRITLFTSKDEAWEKLRATLREAAQEGAVWPKKYIFFVMEAECLT